MIRPWAFKRGVWHPSPEPGIGAGSQPGSGVSGQATAQISNSRIWNDVLDKSEPELGSCMSSQCQEADINTSQTLPGLGKQNQVTT